VKVSRFIFDENIDFIWIVPAFTRFLSSLEILFLMKMEEENFSNLELSEILADFVSKEVTKGFKVLYKFEILSLMIFYKKNAVFIYTDIQYTQFLQSLSIYSS